MLGPTNGAIRRAYTDGQFGQLHVRYAAPARESGLAPCILFCAASSSGLVYEPLLKELGQDRVALAFDTPGYGQSDGPDQVVEHIGVYADLFARALAGVVDGPSDVFGHHSGALLALALASHHPAIVRKVAVTGVPYFPNPLERGQRRESSVEIREAETLRRFVDRSWAYWVTERPADVPFSTGATLFADSLTPGGRLHDLSRAVFEDGAEIWLASIEAPVLYLQIDDVVSANSAQAAKLTPNTTVRERLDFDHLSFISHPSAFASELRRFFDANAPAADQGRA